MISLESIDGLASKAFDLACFIQRDRRAAVSIVAGALAKLEVVATAQGKRLYYRPSGRRWSLRSQSDGLRNKISFNQPHLLQRLIYLESEPYEIAQEKQRGPGGIGEEDLVIHFVKHLVRKTTKRNSFYVTLGLGRLLHSYTTAETMDIYNAVIQDPERVKDDFYYRSRKGVLMQELKQRFGDLINVRHGPRGEERFETDDNPGRFAELVRDCLSFFTPWNTRCLVPAGVDPITEGIPSLSYHGHKKEDDTEVNRIHAVLHPDCFHQLIANLCFDAPETRLDIPRFFYTHDMNSNGSNNRRHSASLHEEELESIKQELDHNAAHRKSAHAGMLRVIVDGNECAAFDLNQTRSTRFHLDSDAELIEVRSQDDTGEEVSLAVQPLAYDDYQVQSANTSITLEGGQKISFVISPVSGDSGATVDIAYGETNRFRAASLWFHQLARSMSSNAPGKVWSDRRILAPALAVLVLAIGLIAVIEFAGKKNAPASPNQVTTSQQTGAPSGSEIPATGNAGTESNKTSNAEDTSRQRRQGVGPSPTTGNTARQLAQPGPETKTETTTETETRSMKKLRTAPLSAVKKVYIQVGGDEISSHSLRETLSEKLISGNRIIVVGNQDEADALLEISVMKSAGAEPDTIRVVVQLINARGEVIWPNANSRKYKGSTFDVSSKIVKGLTAAIQESQGRR